MLVLRDVWDYRAGDEDTGYYYVYVDTEEQVMARLAGIPFEPNFGPNGEDRAHAVLDLRDAPETFSPEICVHPADWLRSRIRAV